MKTTIRLALAILLSLTPLAFAGSSAGSGSGVHDDYYYAAWFADDARTVHYCATISPEFGWTLEQAKGSVEHAFGVWVDYLKTKHLQKLKLARQIAYQPTCDGKQDLQIYFGTSDDTIEKLKKNYDQPIGFSEKLGYDPKAGWGHGVMWLTNPRRFGFYPLHGELYDLDAIVLHEWGHIFGNKHIPKTIMDEDLGYRAIGSGGPAGDALNLPQESIDSRYRELVACSDCQYSFEGNTGPDLRAGFTQLAGHAPVGEAHATFTLQEGYDKKGKLTIRDDKTTATFTWTQVKDIVWRNGDVTAFFSRYGLGNGSAVTTGTGVWLGKLTDESGKKHWRVALSRNLSYVVELVDLDAPVPLHAEDRSNFFHATSFTVSD